MPAKNRNDPYQAFNFTVEIGNTPLAGFSEVSGLGMEVSESEYRAGSDVSSTVRKVPGMEKHTNLTLKRGVTTDKTLFDWIENIRNGVQDYREVVVTLLDEKRLPAVVWKLTNAYPTKWTGPILNAKANEIAIESIELVYEHIKVE